MNKPHENDSSEQESPHPSHNDETITDASEDQHSEDSDENNERSDVKETVPITQPSGTDNPEQSGGSVVSVDRTWIQQLEGESPEESPQITEVVSNRVETLVQSHWKERLDNRSPLFTHGKYEVYNPFDSGGMGAIFWAFDTSLLRPVAFKVLSIDSPSDTLLERFIQEASITAQLSHPNIVPIYDVGKLASGEIFYTMELVEGDSLKTILDCIKYYRDQEDQVVEPQSIEQFKKGKKYTEKFSRIRLLQIFQDVCQTVQYAHNHGVLHRDLKPSNLMIGEEGQVKLLDWGVAAIMKEEQEHLKASPSAETDTDFERKTLQEKEASANDEQERLTEHGEFIGTPAFLSPEQARGELDRINPRSDVFSLGAILYNILTFKPWLGSSPNTDMKETREAIEEKKPFPPRTIDETISPELESITLRCLEKDPEDRYPSAKALHDDLQAFFENRIVSAHSGGWINRVRKTLERNRAVAVLTASFLLISIIATVWFFTRPGTVTVNLQPAEARKKCKETNCITLKNQESKYNIAPGQKTKIPAGQFQLQIHHDDFENLSSPIQIRSRAHQERNIQLTPSTGAIYVQSNVRKATGQNSSSDRNLVQARVKIKKRSSGKETQSVFTSGRTSSRSISIQNWFQSQPNQGLFQLPANHRYEVKVTKKGFLSETRTITVSPGERRTLIIPLLKDEGHLSISGEGILPVAYRKTDTELWNSGSGIAEFPSIMRPLPSPETLHLPPVKQLSFRSKNTLSSGRYSIIARKPGHFSVRESIDIEYNQHSTREFRFSRLPETQHISFSSKPVGYLSRDFTGNNEPDTLILTKKGRLQFYRNGNRVWTTSVPPLHTKSGSIPLTVRDFNDDGFLDVGVRTPSHYLVISLPSGQRVWKTSLKTKPNYNPVYAQGTLVKHQNTLKLLIPEDPNTIAVLNAKTGHRLGQLSTASWEITSRLRTFRIEGEKRVLFLGQNDKNDGALLSGELNRSLEFDPSPEGKTFSYTRDLTGKGNLWRIRRSETKSNLLLCALGNRLFLVNKDGNLLWNQDINDSDLANRFPEQLITTSRRTMFIKYTSGTFLPVTHEGIDAPPFPSNSFYSNKNSSSFARKLKNLDQRHIESFLSFRNGWLVVSSSTTSPHRFLEFRTGKQVREIGTLPSIGEFKNTSSTNKSSGNHPSKKPSTPPSGEIPTELLFARHRNHQLTIGLLLAGNLYVYTFTSPEQPGTLSAKTDTISTTSNSTQKTFTSPKRLSNQRILAGDQQFFVETGESSYKLKRPNQSQNIPADLLHSRSLPDIHFPSDHPSRGIFIADNGDIQLHKSGNIQGNVPIKVEKPACKAVFHTFNNGTTYVYVFSKKGILWKINAETGTPVQSRTLLDAEQSFADLTLYKTKPDNEGLQSYLALLTPDQIFSIHPETLETNWKQTLQNTFVPGGVIEAGDGNGNGTDELYFGTAEGLQIFNGRTGKRNHLLPEYISLRGAPRLVKISPDQNPAPRKILLVPDQLNGRITAVHPRTLLPLWETPQIIETSTYELMNNDLHFEQHVFTIKPGDTKYIGIIGTKTNKIHLFHPVTGEEIFSFHIPKNRKNTGEETLNLKNVFAASNSLSSKDHRSAYFLNRGTTLVGIQLHSPDSFRKPREQSDSTSNHHPVVRSISSSNFLNGSRHEQEIWALHNNLEYTENLISFHSESSLRHRIRHHIDSSGLFSEFFSSTFGSGGKTAQSTTTDEENENESDDSGPSGTVPAHLFRAILQNFNELKPGFQFLHSKIIQLLFSKRLQGTSFSSIQQSAGNNEPKNTQEELHDLISVRHPETIHSSKALDAALSMAPGNLPIVALYLMNTRNHFLHSPKSWGSPLPIKQQLKELKNRTNFNSAFHQWYLDILEILYLYQNGNWNKAKKQLSSRFPEYNRSKLAEIQNNRFLSNISKVNRAVEPVQKVFYYYRRRGFLNASILQQNVYTRSEQLCKNNASRYSWLCAFLTNRDPENLENPSTLLNQLQNLLFTMKSGNDQKADQVRLFLTDRILNLYGRMATPPRSFLRTFYQNYQTLFLKTVSKDELQSLIQNQPDSFRKTIEKEHENFWNQYRKSNR